MEKYTSIKGRAFFFLLFLWFLWFMNFSVRTIFAPIMPLIEDEFVVSHAKASSLFVFTSIGYGISLFFSGMLSGLFGYKKSIILSMSVSSLMLFAIQYVNNFNLLACFAFVLGLSTGIYLPSIIPLLTEYYDEKTWGKVIAIHDSGASLSIFVIPFVAVFFLQFLQWRQILTIFAFVFIACIIMFSLICREISLPRKRTNPLGGIIKNKTLWIMGITWIFAAGANLGVYFIIPLYLTKEIGLDIGYANKIFGISRLGGVFVAIATGFIVDRFSLKKTTFIFILLTGLLTISITYKDTRWFHILLFLQASVAMGFFPIGLVSIPRVFSSEQRSMATGFIVTLGVIFGLGIIPYLLGLSGDFLSFRFGIFLLGICIILSSGLTCFIKELD